MPTASSASVCELDQAFLDECEASLPELPDAKRLRYESTLGLSAYNAAELTADVETARAFEADLAATAAKTGKSASAVATQVANWKLSVAPGVLKAMELSADHPRNTPQANAAILALVSAGTISGGQAKEVFQIVIETGREPEEIVETEGLKQTSDSGAIEAAVDAVLAANADKVAEYKGGKEALFGFFVGQTMKAMQGKGNPGLVNEVLRGKLA